jgi:hypothetical protein
LIAELSVKEIEIDRLFVLLPVDQEKNTSLVEENHVLVLGKNSFYHLTESVRGRLLDTRPVYLPDQLKGICQVDQVTERDDR